jgi:hypothetical protein
MRLVCWGIHAGPSETKILLDQRIWYTKMQYRMFHIFVEKQKEFIEAKESYFKIL